jgi:hypothetical protein
MKTDELQALAGEGAAALAGEDIGAAPIGAASEPGQGSPEHVAALCEFLEPVITGAGGAVCGVLRVPSLTDDEAKRLTAAAANVAKFYDFAQLDPKSAAWIGLGMTAAGIVMPRIGQRAPLVAAQQEPELDANVSITAESAAPIAPHGPKVAAAGEHAGQVRAFESMGLAP